MSMFSSVRKLVSSSTASSPSKPFVSPAKNGAQKSISVDEFEADHLKIADPILLDYLKKQIRNDNVDYYATRALAAINNLLKASDWLSSVQSSNLEVVKKDVAKCFTTGAVKKDNNIDLSAVPFRSLWRFYPIVSVSSCEQIFGDIHAQIIRNPEISIVDKEVLLKKMFQLHDDIKIPVSSNLNRELATQLLHSVSTGEIHFLAPGMIGLINTALSPFIVVAHASSASSSASGDRHARKPSSIPVTLNGARDESLENNMQAAVVTQDVHEKHSPQKEAASVFAVTSEPSEVAVAPVSRELTVSEKLVLEEIKGKLTVIKQACQQCQANASIVLALCEEDIKSIRGEANKTILPEKEWSKKCLGLSTKLLMIEQDLQAKVELIGKLLELKAKLTEQKTVAVRITETKAGMFSNYSIDMQEHAAATQDSEFLAEIQVLLRFEIAGQPNHVLEGQVRKMDYFIKAIQHTEILLAAQQQLEGLVKRMQEKMMELENSFKAVKETVEVEQIRVNFSMDERFNILNKKIQDIAQELRKDLPHNIPCDVEKCNSQIDVMQVELENCKKLGDAINVAKSDLQICLRERVEGLRQFLAECEKTVVTVKTEDRKPKQVQVMKPEEIEKMEQKRRETEQSKEQMEQEIIRKFKTELKEKICSLQNGFLISKVFKDFLDKPPKEVKNLNYKTSGRDLYNTIFLFLSELTPSERKVLNEKVSEKVWKQKRDKLIKDLQGLSGVCLSENDTITYEENLKKYRTALQMRAFFKAMKEFWINFSKKIPEENIGALINLIARIENLLKNEQLSGLYTEEWSICAEITGGLRAIRLNELTDEESKNRLQYAYQNRSRVSCEELSKKDKDSEPVLTFEDDLGQILKNNISKIVSGLKSCTDYISNEAAYGEMAKIGGKRKE